MKVAKPDCDMLRAMLGDPSGNANAAWLEANKAASSQNFLQDESSMKYQQTLNISCFLEVRATDHNPLRRYPK
jgi:hypothetical protein